MAMLSRSNIELLFFGHLFESLPWKIMPHEFLSFPCMNYSLSLLIKDISYHLYLEKNGISRVYLLIKSKANSFLLLYNPFVSLISVLSSPIIRKSKIVFWVENML